MKPLYDLRRRLALIRASDFGLLGFMLNHPDQFVVSGTSTSGVPIIRLEKLRGAERIVALFEFRSGRRRLALTTMWVELVGGSPTSTP